MNTMEQGFDLQGPSRFTPQKTSIDEQPLLHQNLQSQEHHQVVVQPPPMLNHATLLLGPENTCTACPFCLATVKTSVKYTTTTRTHILAAICCHICLCCCIPYCMNSAKNVDHYCPNCYKYIGTYNR